MTEQPHQDHWWGEFELSLDETAKWEIGPLRFWLHRSSLEWRLAHDWTDDEMARDWSLTRPSALPEEMVETERFAVRETGSAVHLRPLPASRAVVARPKTPFRVLPGQRSRIFISSPLWVEIAAGPGPTILRELPSRRLSDTWFGASTRDGELSYALKTNTRTSLHEMPRAVHRLLTPVVVENRGEDSLLVERLSLPVPFLSVYGMENGETWSEEVRMLRTEAGEMAELDVRHGPPAEAGGAGRLSEPRQTSERGQLFRAFGSLLGFDL